MLAKPLASLNRVVWLAPKITGIPADVPPGSPAVRDRLFPEGRSTVDWNNTLAPRTGLGGVDESVTRTVSG